LWALYWHNASAEAVRINALFSGAQALRGDVYRGVKEVTRAQLQQDPAALDKYWRLLYGIDLSFNRLGQNAENDDELAGIAAMREAYARMQTAMNRVFADSLQVSEIARVEMLDPAYERFILGDFEQGFQMLAATINTRRTRLEQKLARFNQLAPALISVPIAIGVALLLLTRRRFLRDFVVPMESIRKAAGRMRGGELNTTIDDDGVQELRELAQTLNDMSQELARSRDALVANERQAALGALVPVVAHNIRNPLASIRAAVQVADPADPAEWAESREQIIATVDRLGRWVSSLLHYLHPLKPHPVGCRITDLLDGAVATCAVKIDEKQLRIDRSGVDDGLTLQADVDLVEQALHGLISNAIEASPTGADIRLTTELPAANTIRLVISDRGPGIAPQTEPEALRPGPTTKRRGTGLGIPFAYKVVRGHQGELRFERPAEGGTRAVIDLPRRQSGTAEEDQPPADSADGSSNAGQGA
jgi:signal transduction histidine kinase